MSLLIKVQGEANAQALFDVMNRDGVSWKRQRGGWHFLTIERTDARTEGILRSLFRDTKMTFVKEG